MRLLEAILEANRRHLLGNAPAGLPPGDLTTSLPLVALTCIDPRLNALLPAVLGISEEQFIWLRNAGNIITSSTSSTMRSLALACALKGGREIAVIGHTDCKVRQATVMEVTDRFHQLGVERARLPDNLNEFFGLFASERQNVIKGVEFVRQSPLIGPGIPVHGLLLDVHSGELEWLANGYQVLASSVVSAPPDPSKTVPPPPLPALPDFDFGEMKFPDSKIGDVSSPASPPELPRSDSRQTMSSPALQFDPTFMFKVVGIDRKIHGPLSGAELERWLAAGRIKLDSLVQKLGYKEWRQLADYALAKAAAKTSTPPPVIDSSQRQSHKKPKT